MWVFISSLCVNSVMIHSVFAIIKIHMGTFQAAPAPSTWNSCTELHGGGDGPHGSRARREGISIAEKSQRKALGGGGRGISEQGKGSRA